MNQNAGLVVVIVSVAGDVMPAFNDQTRLAQLAGDPFGQYRTGKARSDD